MIIEENKNGGENMKNRTKSKNSHSNIALLERPTCVETTLNKELVYFETSTSFLNDITTTNYTTRYDVTESLTKSKECLLKLKQFRDELADSPTPELLTVFFNLLH